MIELIITSAGKKEIVNAQQTGTSAIKLSHIGVGSGKYTATEAQTSLQSETKRLPIVDGGATGDSAIHVALMDESADAYSVHEIGVYTDTGVLFAVTSSQTALAEKGAASSLLLAIDVAFADLDASVFTFGDLTYSNAAATNENAGVISTATDAEATAGTSTQKAITPSTLSVALNARAATNAEAQAGTSTSKFVTPASLSSRTATTGRTGLVALATDAEAASGSNSTKAVTAAGVAYAIANYAGTSNGLKATATGANTARTLADHFSDSISPKDFGATTSEDATAAFSALEAVFEGSNIDLDGQTYIVTAIPTGNRYHNGGFSVGGVHHPAIADVYRDAGTAHEAIDARRDFSEASRGGGALLAADWVRSGDGAGAVVQSAVWDDANRYLYTLHTTTSDKGVINRFAGTKFGAAVINSSTAYSAASAYIGHQGLGLQYLSGGAVKLWASMAYETAGASVESKGTKAVRFTPPSTNGASVDASVELFNLFPTSANRNQATTVCTSYSGRYLIAKMNEDGLSFWIRIFRLADLTTAGDYSNKFLHEFHINLSRDTAEGPVRALQGMACDDRHIYFLASTYGYSAKHSIYITDMLGNVVDEYRDLSVGKEAGKALGTTYYEPQSLFFMSLNGAPTLVLQVATGDTEGKRLCHLFALNSRRSFYFPVGVGYSSQHGVAIDEQARIVNAEGSDNMSLYPSGLSTFTQARAGVNQAAFARFSNDTSGTSLVFLKSRGASVGTSSSAVAGDVIGQIQFLADNGNIDYAGSAQGARAGFISGEVFESSTLTTAGTTNLGVRGIVKICACSDAAGREGKGVEVIDNGFRPTDDNTHNLGTAGRRWKAIYAATDVISTSDMREKRDIGDIPDSVLRAIGRVQFRQYRLKDDPLYYFGVVAQDVIQAFDDEGLDAFDYGVVFIDTLDDGSYRYSVSYRDIMVLEAERKRRFE